MDSMSMWVRCGWITSSMGSYMVMTRGMPTGPHVDFGSKSMPTLALAMLASWIARYSGVSGGCCPSPAGLDGSHTPGGLPRFHEPVQVGYLLASRALTLAGGNAMARAIAAAPNKNTKRMHSSLGAFLSPRL